MSKWYSQDIQTTLRDLKTGPDGLTTGEASRRFAEVGPNQLTERPGRSPLSVLLGQFKDTMVIVLLIAAAISFALALTTHETSEYTDAIMIMIIVILNAILGFTQEFSAERAMAALKQMTVSVVRVRRGGQIREVRRDAAGAGRHHADRGRRAHPGRRTPHESANLRVEEAALTGESVPVDKIVESLSGESASIGDRRNMVLWAPPRSMVEALPL